MNKEHTYKILIDPSTFEQYVIEITLPNEINGLLKRRMSHFEVKTKWSQQEFIAELSKWGYEYAAKIYINQHTRIKI